MNRPHPSLSQHLLTRSDLAQLEIPAARVAHWLSKGWLEQVAALSAEHGVPNPVFAVLDDQLKDELSSRLVELGKAEVVFSPLRIRSVLLRSLLRTSTDSSSVHDHTTGNPVYPSGDPLLDALPDSLLSKTLKLAAVGLANEAQHAVALARAEAHLEILEKAVSATVARSFVTSSGSLPATKAAPDPTIDPPNGVPASEEHMELQYQADDLELDLTNVASDEEHFFDVGDLMVSFTEDLDDSADLQPSPVELLDSPQDELVQQGSGLAMVMDLQAPEATAAPDATEPLDPYSATLETPSPEFIEVSGSGQGEMEMAEQEEQVIAQFPESNVEQVLDYLAASMQDFAEDNASGREPSFHETPMEFKQGNVDDSMSVAQEPAALVAGSQGNLCDSVVPASSVEFQALTKVENFLAELRSSLIQIADRPQVESMNFQPIADAIAENAKASQAAAKDGVDCLRQLGDRVAALGKHFEHGLALAVHAAISCQASKDSVAPAVAPSSAIVAKTVDRTVTVVAAIAFLLACWSIVLWWRTGNAKLAIAVLVGANAIGCCLLASRRRG
jgi:hypothetical protein